MQESLVVKTLTENKEVLVYLEPDSPEQQMTNWLSEALTDSMVFVSRYWHYKQISEKIHKLIHAPSFDHNQETIWLIQNYCIPIGAFAWMMEAFCYHKISPDLLIDQKVPVSPVDYDLEFNLDLKTVQQTYITDDQQRKEMILKNSETSQRIDLLCYTLDDLLTQVEAAYYQIPLRILANTHKHLAHCAEFSRFMLYN